MLACRLQLIVYDTNLSATRQVTQRLPNVAFHRSYINSVRSIGDFIWTKKNKNKTM